MVNIVLGLLFIVLSFTCLLYTSKLAVGDELDFKELKKEQKFTQPPSRYSEAALIRALEENGIGRPSTYAPTISTILERRYVEKDGKTLVPTQLGFITTDIMLGNFNDIVDISFTASVEDRLDQIEEGRETYLSVLNSCLLYTSRCV